MFLFIALSFICKSEENIIIKQGPIFKEFYGKLQRHFLTCVALVYLAITYITATSAIVLTGFQCSFEAEKKF